MSERITITVAGHAGVGKTTMSHVLQDALTMAGFKVTLDCHELAETPSAEDMAKRFASMIHRDVEVVITSQQLKRERMPVAAGKPW